MIRKFLMVAAAAAIPVSALTAVGLSGTAFAGGSVSALSCSLSGSDTFPTPGLSTNGVVSKAKTSTTKAITSGTGSGCGAPIKSNIKGKTQKCTGTNKPVQGCALKENYYDTSAGFATQGTTDIVSSLKKGIKTTDFGTPVTLEVTKAGASSINPGGACGSNVGFQLKGAVKGYSNTYTAIFCLSGDTGPNTTGVFINDLVASAQGNTSIVIATAILDPSTSSLVIS